jgi:hypothetical protein
MHLVPDSLANNVSVARPPPFCCAPKSRQHLCFGSSALLFFQALAHPTGIQSGTNYRRNLLTSAESFHAV